MKVTFPTDDKFKTKTGVIAGEECVLVTPEHVSPAWDDENTIFRSSIWTKGGEPVSLGFKKFTNWGERPLFEPFPVDLPFTAVEKLDGSLLIVSRYKGELITRTRGTFDAHNLENGHEVDMLIEKYPLAFKHPLLDVGYTLLFEWTTPSNLIVLNYTELAMRLVGIVDHADYSYYDQKLLDREAVIMNVGRPRYYHFNNLEEVLSSVTGWRDAEGVVVYSECGQILKKFKGEWYKHQHYFKTGMRSIKRAIEVWDELDGPRNKVEFFDAVESHYDHEIATILADYITTIGDTAEEVYSILDEVRTFLPKQPDDRKTRALWLNEHGAVFKALGFLLLAGREVDTAALTKIIKRELV